MIPSRLTYRSLFQNFFMLGVIAFGPGMFALIHQRMVEQKQWMTEGEFREAVTFSELAPGPFTLHVVMYVGYCLKGFWGLVGSTFFFSLPSLITVMILASSFESYISKIPGLKFFLIGVLAAILASMVSTIIKISRGIPWSWLLILITCLSVTLVISFKMNFVVLILGSGLLYVAIQWSRLRLIKKGS